MSTAYRTFYDPVDGHGIYSTNQAIEPYPDWVEGLYDMTLYYFPNGVPTLRLTMTPTITGNDPVVVGQPVSFTGFPLGATFRVSGTGYTLDDGAINFTPTTPGDYRVVARHMEYLAWEGMISAS